MFFKDEWMCLSDLSNQLHAAELWDMNPDEERYKFVDRTITKHAWSFLSETKEIRVMLGNGETVRGSKMLVYNPYVGDFNSHIDLSLGTVGSGKDENGNSFLCEELTLTYGPFLGCPILVREAEVEKYLQTNYPDLPRRSNGPLTEPEVAAFVERKHRLGRPKLADGWIELVVKNEFLIRHKKGRLAADQRDATISDAIEWIGLRFEQKVPRTTMQRYLKLVFDAVDAQK